MKSVKSDYFAKKWTPSLSEGLRMLPKSKKFVKLSVEMDFGVKEKLKTLRRLRSLSKKGSKSEKASILLPNGLKVSKSDKKSSKFVIQVSFSS